MGENIEQFATHDIVDKLHTPKVFHTFNPDILYPYDFMKH